MSTKVFENRLRRLVPANLHFRVKRQGDQRHLDILWKSKRLAWVSENLTRTLYISDMTSQWLTLAKARVAQDNILKYAKTPIDKR